MKQNKRGILVLTSMILAIGLMFGSQAVRAADGDLNSTGGILLKDTNSNGKIDEVHITVDYAVASASAIDHATDEATTIGKFIVTDSTSSNAVTISSISFVSGDGIIAIFKLVLDETDTDLSANTSGTALNVVYNATDSDLKITNGTTSVSVASITSDVEEKDGAHPIILTAKDQNGTSLDGATNISLDANIIITFSEQMDITTISANDEWSISPNPGNWSMPSWDVSEKFVTFEKVGNFASGTVETVTLIAPLAVGGVNNADKALQNTPDDSVVSNPFTFTTTGGTVDEKCDDEDEDECDDEDEDDDDDEDNECDDEDEDNITPPDGAVAGPTTPNCHSGVTLYRMPGSHKVYVIKNKKKHWIKTAKEFEKKGYDWKKIQEISAELLEKYPDAEPLVSDLLRAIGSNKVYKIKDGKKHWIRTAEEFSAAGYNWDQIKEVSPEVLVAYQDAVSSDLLRAVGDHKVYKIKDGKKHWIRTAEEFSAAGYNWEDVREVIAETLKSYPDLDSEAVSIKIVDALVLRVRSDSSTAGAVLDTVKKSEVYKFIEKKNGWYKIKTKSGKSGWVSGSYVEEQ
ncbi:MAG: SH3 domain-containing protein [Patescibacteria group bacterium]|nr:SH3 domain-containing protein [Patescibacteria group bacterium]